MPSLLVTSVLLLSLLLQCALAQSWVETFRTPVNTYKQPMSGHYGKTTAISDDGSIVAIGIEVSNGMWTTHVYQASPWTLQQIIPNSGFSLSLSSDGTRLATGNMWANGQKGRVAVMQYNGTHWVQQGMDITSTDRQPQTGYSVAMNGDGTRIIVGYRQHTGGGIARGRVEIFHWIGDAWVSQLAKNGDIDMLR